jgi:hypothetical protein
MEKRPRDPEFSERLRKLMKQKGIKNNNQLALTLKKAPIVTHGWLRGKVPGYPEDWKLLCDFFDVSADYLLLGKDGAPRKEEHEHENIIQINLKIPVDAHDKKAIDLRDFLGVPEEENREGFRRMEDKALWALLLALLRHRVVCTKDEAPE